MIRTRKIIGKDKIFEYVGNENIAKLEILTSKQKSLKNDQVCSVYIYHRVNFMDVCNILGRCRTFIETHPDREKYKSFVTGLMSARQVGFVSECNINKLIEITKKTGYFFGISQQIADICTKK